MPLMNWLVLAAVLGCGKKDADSGPSQTVSKEAPWTGELRAAVDLWAPENGLQARRSVIHLHSPWSHDACDGAGLDPQDDPSGTPNASCLQDLRDGLCRTRFDFAFVTDHPSYSAFQDWDRLLLDQPGDEPVTNAQGETVGFRIPCDDGHRVLWVPGYEDELMPVAFDRHLPGDGPARDATANQSDPATLTAMKDAGAAVLIAHTEGRDRTWLEGLQDAGLTGIEIFNLHAMFAPDIREEDLGLSPFGWTTGVEAFTTPEGGGEPDLLFLAVLQHQPPSLAAFDALLERGPIVGMGGTDAHQNVLNYDLADGERGDSYRRMLRWFSNVLLTEGDTPEAAQAALEAGRNYVVFEALGSPVDFTVWFESAGQVHPVGSSPAGPGTLQVGCPQLSPGAPRGPLDPEITVRVLKDGETWATECGALQVTEPGNYRVEVEVVPHHLEPFLGTSPADWIRAYPWIYSNAIRVQ